ncbi:MAG: chemotaxis response regulator protein-glutamate methylesterase [Bryobacteraceae bacterium]|nr:chemotaxis response regulator protein-glutamate methylesterase [Bryobacteraceae bacterium]
MSEAKKIRVLVVDDSAIVRKVLTEVLSQQPDIEVVGTAPDAFVARDKIVSLRPDVLTLDVEMPRMDGLTFLEKLMKHYPLPVIVLSSLTQNSTRAALEALNRGAVDVLAKPGGPYSVADLKDDLPQRVRAAAAARIRRNGAAAAPPPPAAPAPAPAARPRTEADGPPPQQVIAIGASTGGTVAIERILAALPAEVPPIVITQHIPPGFSRTFAQRLNTVCALEVREAEGGERLENGLALVAPGNRHLEIERIAGGGWRTRLHDGPKVCYQRPSVDVLFRSVAREAGAHSIGVLLTGMGADGAAGLLEMRRAGAPTIAQNEETCVVFGMPREAIRMGAAQQVLPLDEIAGALAKRVRVPMPA